MGEEGRDRDPRRGGRGKGPRSQEGGKREGTEIPVDGGRGKGPRSQEMGEGTEIP